MKGGMGKKGLGLLMKMGLWKKYFKEGKVGGKRGYLV